ncbi:multidrug and toxin extrusion protein 2-like isoform X1 [Corticium candelabrum]|uniref:multidrug and toxin extrusion protein 2-like isoform X1 n=2 Tax=Corticium candelabrum TaxID=121492 RepID=UPI002E26480F|nr:multidrug and toxin extrusion protein 2-like isoform X1 [Corticium candelabrum]
MSSTTRSGCSVGETLMKCCGHCISKSVKDEVKALLCLAWPVTLTVFLQFFLSEMNLLFCGHIGKLELDAAGLALSFTNVTGLSVGMGMSAACDTLISQAFGAKKFYKIGIIIQKGILILSLVMLPIWAVWLNAGSLLQVLNQDPEVVKQAAVVCKILIIGLPGNFLYTLLRKYLQNQGIVKPVAVIGFIIILISALTHFITVILLDLGLLGAAGSLVFCQLLQPVICLAIIRYKKLGRNTWNGWSWECVVDWWMFLRLGLPSVAMVCTDWWTFEIVVLVAGMVSIVDLGASVVTFQVIATVFMVPLGLALAAAVRVGTFLGANQPTKAKRTAWVSISLVGLFTVFISVLLLSLRSSISYIFTSDKDVVTLVAKAMLVVAPILIVDGLQGSIQGVYRGAGRQKTGAAFNLIGSYFVGLPIGVPLALIGKKGIIGLWIGVLCGLVVMALGGLIVVLRLDWIDEAMKAQKRMGVVSDSLENLSEDNCEQTETCLQVKDIVDQNEDDENSCHDSLALLVDEPSDVNKDQRCLNKTTIEDASFKCATQNFKFEMEPKSMMSPSQKRTALGQKLLLFLAGAMIVIGAGITSNFFSYQDPNLYNSTCNASSFHIYSTGTGLPFVTTAVVTLSVTSAAGALPVTSPKYSCTTSCAFSTNTPALPVSRGTVHPRPSKVLKLYSSSYAISLFSRQP